MQNGALPVTHDNHEADCLLDTHRYCARRLYCLFDAGLGCPDWPGCYGNLAVPSNATAISEANLQFPERALEADKAWIEMIHRYFAGSLGLLIFVVVAWCIKKNITSVGLPFCLFPPL